MSTIDYQLTLMDSAQVFHWQKIEDEFAAVVDGEVLTDRSTDVKARAYFDSEREYLSLVDACGVTGIVAKAVHLLPGLRVLNQPPWEALIAFILSANNNVQRIRNLVTALCKEYGERHIYKDHALYGFPKPEVRASLDPCVLKKHVTCGYRAEYLVETAQTVCDGFPLDQLKTLPLSEARKRLVSLKGVGPKVADCVLLFGCRHTEAFPVDVWVKRLMEKWFHISGSPAQIAERARALWGDRCGLIQQYLFHAARCGLIDL